MGKYSIGTSGYQYLLWKDSFYPSKLPPKEYLKYYAKSFDTVEINYSFYQLPTKNTILSWYNDTPKNFRFSIKVNQYITHYKKIKGIKASLNKFISRISLLKEKLACILFQFSRNFSSTEINQKRVDKLKKFLPKTIKVAFEFRHKSWYNDKIYDMIKNNGWMFVISYYPKNFIKGLNKGFNPDISKIKFKNVYIRMHGMDGTYIGSYDRLILNDIKKYVKNNGINYAFIYFNNTDSVPKNKYPDAIKDSLTLKSILKY